MKSQLLTRQKGLKIQNNLELDLLHLGHGAGVLPDPLLHLRVILLREQVPETESTDLEQVPDTESTDLDQVPDTESTDFNRAGS